MRRILLLFFWLLGHSLFAQHSDKSIEILRDLQTIHTPEGIELLEQIELNGTKQWVSIRGKDRSNPVLLVLHGGPASPLMPISWAYQTPWEDYFTVVNWDQKLAGKNWLEGDSSRVDRINFRGLIQDAYLLVDSLRARLNQDKIFLMGYSYGAGMGIRMAARIPQKLHAYIGVGQMAPGNPELVIYQRLLQLASEAGNEEALEELEAIAPYPNPEGGNPIRKILTVRKWARYFNGGWYGKENFDLLFQLPEPSPLYTAEEISSLDISSPWISRKMLAQGGGGEFPLDFEIPIFFMMGRHDLHTPYQGAADYFQQLSAPQKEMFTFENSGHVPFLEEPGRFLVTLVNHIRVMVEDKKTPK